MVKTWTYILGVVLVLVGILGFFNNPILGLFTVNATHNLIHLITGAALIIIAMMGGKALSNGLITLGVIYALVTILGFILTPSGGLLLGLVLMNALDNYLHLVLAVVFLLLGFARSGAPAPARV